MPNLHLGAVPYIAIVPGPSSQTRHTVERTLNPSEKKGNTPSHLQGRLRHLEHIATCFHQCLWKACAVLGLWLVSLSVDRYILHVPDYQAQQYARCLDFLRRGNPHLATRGSILDFDQEFATLFDP